MKKKLMMSVVLMMSAFALSACGATEDNMVKEAMESTQAVESVVEETTVEVVETELSEIYSYQISINGIELQFPMWYSEFEAAGFTYMGDATKTLEPCHYTIEDIWTMDGVEVETSLGNRSINTQPYTKCMVSGIDLESDRLEGADWEIILPKGIQYGVSTKEDILAAYGTPTYEFEDSWYYKMTYGSENTQKIYLRVDKESGVLGRIEIQNFVDLEGIDNSVNEAVPEEVTKYTAPTEVGDDLYRFNAKIEGHLYTFPCPVSEFLANGFTILKDENEDVVAAASLSGLTLSYNDQSILVMVANYADYATIPENCFVISFETNKDSWGNHPTLDVTVPCGIKLEESEASLKEKISAFYYEEEKKNDYKSYVVYNPNGTRQDYFSFRVKEGIVTYIYFSTDNMPGY